MSKDDGVALVRGIFDAMERGDQEAITGAMAESFELIYPGPKTIPFAGTWKGMHRVGEFMAAFHAAAEIESSTNTHFLGSGDRVVVLVTQRLKVRKTGHVIHEDAVLVWTVAGGKATRLEEYHDTAAIAAAFA